MTKQNGPHYDENYLRQGSPTNTTFAESMPILHASSNIAIAASGVELSIGVPLQFGDVITNVSFATGTTAANGPTAGYVCLRDPAGALLKQSADLGSTARAANTAYTIALASAYTVTVPGLYYIGVSFTVSTTVPSVHGKSLANLVMAGALGLSRPILCQSHGSAVGAVAPATIVTPTTVATIPWVACT